MKAYFLWLAKLITVVVVFFFILPVVIIGMLAAVGAAVGGADGIVDGKKTVAVIQVDGVIQNSRDVVEQLHKQVAEEKVKGIVLRVDSPGGAVGPSQEIFDAVRTLKVKKPIVASMASVAASGGLYVSLGASKIFAEPGTMTGSIGVIMQLPVYKQIADKVGFQMVTIKSGKLKDVGNGFREMTPEEKAFLEDTVHDAHEDFIKAVAEGRNLDIAKVRQFADGRILMGAKAKELGVVDEFGGVFEAGRAVFDILGEPLPEGEYPKLYYPGDKYREVKELLHSISNLPLLFQQGFKLQYLAW